MAKSDHEHRWEHQERDMARMVEVLDLRYSAIPVSAIYGLAEIAQAIGVSVEKVRDWREAGHLPEPTAKLKAGYVWTAEDIEWWIEQHRRKGSRGEEAAETHR